MAITAGGATATLTLTGSNFVSGSTAQWNGKAIATTVVSSTQLTATVGEASISTPGFNNVTVVSPTPGGGTSSFVIIAVTAPGPVITSLSPASVAAAGAAFTLTVNGNGFTPASIVSWNGTSRPTTFVGATQLTAAIAAQDIAFAGSGRVVVVNPAAGAGSSNIVSQASGLTITGDNSNVSFIADYGNDSGPGTLGQPYLTIQKCAATVSAGATCAIRGGTYYETVTPNSGITLTSYDGETVTLDGTDAVTGWAPYQGNIYSASVTMSSGDTNQVFVNGVMMTEARWPNGDDVFHVNWATLKSGTSSGQIVDSNLPNIDWTGARVHFWSGADPWAHQTGTITSSRTGQLTFSADGAPFCPYICVQSGGYYFVYGILGALDTQREWAYVPGANQLYLWAPGAANPASLSVRVKQRPYAIDLSGTSNVVIQHLNLFATSINSNSSSTNNTINDINAQYVSHFTTLPDAGGNGTSWNAHVTDSGIILNGSGNVLENSTIAYSAGNGVALLGSGNTVQNTLIHHVDYVGNYTAGVSLTGGHHEIRNNTIYAAGRSAVWPSYAATGPDDISYNNFYNAMMLSRDGGEIYVANPGPSGTTIHHNWLHDTQSLMPGSGDTDALSGVYLDEDANGYEIYQNVMWNDQIVSIFVNGSTNGVTTPNNNNIHNNSILDASANSYVWFGGIAIQNCGTAQVVDNLVLVPARDSNSPACTFANNSISAPGATDMTGSVHVGCNFAGCATDGPPVVDGISVAASIATQPYGMTVATGQTATFRVTGAGSAPLSYQWQRNGVAISGATAAAYTVSSTTAADAGAVFTVTVSNSMGSVTSKPAVLALD